MTPDAVLRFATSPRLPLEPRMRLAPADVSGGPVARVRRGLVWWRDGTLFVASGVPSDPTVIAYPTGDVRPVRVGRSYRIGPVVVSSCGCSSPWKRVDESALEPLATDGVELTATTAR